MNWIAKISFYLKSLFLRKQLDAQLTEEIRTHVEMATEANVAKGMTPEEARYAALREFGNVAGVQERAREERGWVWLEQLGKDLCLAVRSLAKAPGYTVAVVATLAIGIGATTAMVSIARQALLPSLPFPAEKSLVVIEDFNTQQNTPFIVFAERYTAFRTHTKSFARFAATRSEGMNLLVDGQPVAMQAGWVTPDFFAVFGVQPLLGRTFMAEDHRPDAAGTVVVLSHQAWLQQFASDPAIIGRDILLGGIRRRVVGVMPAVFRNWPGSMRVSVYLPLAGEGVEPPEALNSPAASRLVWVAGRLQEGVTPSQAQAELALTRMPPGTWSGLWDALSPRVIPIREKFKADASHLFWVFLGAVGCLYAIAWANAANLMLVRLVTRRRELGVRLALGGSRGQLMRMLLAESLLLTGLAGVAGVLLAYEASKLLDNLITAWLPVGQNLQTLDYPALVTAGTICLLTGLLLGMVSAWRVGRANLQDVLKEGAGSLGDSLRQRRFRDGLVVLQTALATALLIGGGLMVRSFVRLEKNGVGFNTAGLYLVLGNLPSGLSREEYFVLSDRLVAELRQLPGVETAAQADVAPMSSTFGSSFARIDGRPELGDIQCSFNSISSGYFATLGLVLLAGRDFAGAHPGDPPMAIINETMARRYFSGASPLGQRLDQGRGRKCEIVGVVADVREQGPRHESLPQVYVPVWQRESYNNYFVNVLVRLTGEPGANSEAAVRHAAYAADPRLVVNLAKLDDGARFAVRVERCTLSVLQVLSGLALALAVMGLFAVMTYAVAQRQREFGVRLALGAAYGDLQRLVLQRGLALAVTGVVIGLGVAWSLTRLLQSVLFETNPHDPLTYGSVAIGLLVAAALASWLPARRAAKVDPMVALRAE